MNFSAESLISHLNEVGGFGGCGGEELGPGIQHGSTPRVSPLLSTYEQIIPRRLCLSSA